MPWTVTPRRRSASTWTVPMKPEPMTAAPMSLTGFTIRAPCRYRSACLRWYFYMSSAKVGHSTAERTLGDMAEEDDAGIQRPGAPGGRAPMPHDALDALVTVLDEIRLGRSRSRSELVDSTGLGRGVVAQRVGELLDRGLVVEGDVGPSTGGRPPRQLSFRGDAGHLMVADLGATSIDVAATTLDGRVLAHHAEPADIGAGPEVCLGRVEELFRKLDPGASRAARAAVGHRYRGARARGVPDRSADVAAHHARLGRLSHPGALRGRATRRRYGSTTT